MDLQVVPAPLYRLENGIPAYKAGEWEGIKPNHFHRTRLILKQIRNDGPIKYPHKRIIHKSSSDYEFRPSVKLVNSYFENIEKNRKLKFGRKYIPEDSINMHKLIRYPNINIKIRPKDNFTSGSTVLPIISVKKDDNSQVNKNISFSNSSEINIESTMNKKKRITSLEQQRNYYKKINPGDKNYRYAEHSPDYFKEGGLVVGSTNRIRITDNFHKLRNNIYQTMDLNIKSLDHSKLWKNKLKQESDINDNSYVHKLELWEKIYVREDDNKNNDDKNKGKDAKKSNIITKNEKIKKKVKIK